MADISGDNVMLSQELIDKLIAKMEEEKNNKIKEEMTNGN